MRHLIFIIIVAAIFTGCKKEENSVESINVTQKENEISCDSMGIVHNDCLDYIHANYDSKNDDIDTIFKKIDELQIEYFDSLGYQTSHLPLTLKPLMENGDAVDWVNDLYKNDTIDFSLQFKNYLVELLNYTYNGQSEQYTKKEYYSFADSLYADASKILGSKELEKFSCHISVAKSSYIYWFKSDGTPKHPWGYSSRLPGWDTFAVDCAAGLAAGLVSGGTAAAPAYAAGSAGYYAGQVF